MLKRRAATREEAHNAIISVAIAHLDISASYGGIRQRTRQVLLVQAALGEVQLVGALDHFMEAGNFSQAVVRNFDFNARMSEELLVAADAEVLLIARFAFEKPILSQPLALGIGFALQALTVEQDVQAIWRRHLNAGVVEFGLCEILGIIVDKQHVDQARSACRG